MRFILDGGSVGSRETLHRTLAAGLHSPTGTAAIWMPCTTA